MAQQDPDEVVVGSHGDIYVAPVGTALPTQVDSALNAAFVKLGFVSEDGVTPSVGSEIEEFGAWQRRQPIRRERISQDISLSFALMQWNAETIKFAFGGGTVAEYSPGEFRYDFPSGVDALDERALVLDWQDGETSLWRLVIARGSVTEAVEFTLARNAPAVLPITFSALGAEGDVSTASLFVGDSEFHS